MSNAEDGNGRDVNKESRQECRVVDVEDGLNKESRKAGMQGVEMESGRQGEGEDLRQSRQSAQRM
mgnify:FL=1